MKKIISLALAAPIVLTLFATVAVAQSESREEILKQIQTRRAELSALEKKFLAPAEEDLTAYADFLKQPDTGLIRLLPREVYDTEVYKKNGKTLTMRGGGAYYSFARLTHEYGYGSDLQLESSYLSVGFAGANFGFLQNINDTPIETFTTDDPSARFMAGYTPPAELPKARQEQRRFADAAIKSNEQAYRDRLPVAVGSTYLLRSINYDTSDVLVVFRIVRKDADGSVTLAWKLLKKYPKPELVRNNTPDQ